MNYDNLCYNCMHEKYFAAMSCPFCGAPSGMEHVPGLLEPQTILKGRYLLGNSKGQKDHLIEYIALNLEREEVVTIYEFYLPEQMYRSTRSFGLVRLLVETPENRYLFEEWKKRIWWEAYIEFYDGFIRNGILLTDYFMENGTIYIVWTHCDEKASLESICSDSDIGLEDKSRTYIWEKGGKREKKRGKKRGEKKTIC